jgi:tetratricopeptide (TPR) repeat protein
MSRWLPLLPALLCLCWAAWAGAESAPPPEQTAQARGHFARGVAAYDRGVHEAALAEFRAAHRLYPAPELLLNVARCELKLARKADALLHLRAFLTARPDDPEAAQLRRQAAALEAELAPPAAVIATPPPELPRRPPQRRFPLYGTLAAAGAGALLLAGGATLLTVRLQVDGLAAECQPECAPEQVDPLRAAATAGYTLLGVGGALAVTALIVLPLELRAAKRR